MQKLEFNFKPSKYYLTTIFLLLLLTSMVIVSLPLNDLLKSIALTFVIFYLGYLCWHHGLLRSNRVVTSIKHETNGKWYLYTKHKIYSAELCGDSTITQWITVLRFRLHDHFWHKSCLIMQDSLPPDDYRRLIVIVQNSY